MNINASDNINTNISNIETNLEDVEHLLFHTQFFTANKPNEE